jgi:hypothetical protein
LPLRLAQIPLLAVASLPCDPYEQDDEAATPQPNLPSKGLAVERIKALSRATKVVLASGILLFLDLFFTWQQLEVDYGSSGTARQALDAWDAWGLLVGLGTLAIVTLVIVLRVSDLEVSPDVPWNRIVLGLSAAVLLLTVLKNLTDADSAVASYVGIVLAALVAAGAFLTRDEEPRELVAPPSRPAVERNGRPAYKAPSERERSTAESAGQKW